MKKDSFVFGSARKSRMLLFLTLRHLFVSGSWYFKIEITRLIMLFSTKCFISFIFCYLLFVKMQLYQPIEHKVFKKPQVGYTLIIWFGTNAAASEKLEVIRSWGLDF